MAFKPQQVDLSRSSLSGARPGIQPGDLLTYTVQIVNAGTLSTTFSLTDSLPLPLAYVPGSAWAATGQITYSHELEWTGVVSSYATISATFAVTVSGTLTQGLFVDDVAWLQGDPLGPLDLHSPFVVNGRRVYLPVVVHPRQDTLAEVLGLSLIACHARESGHPGTRGRPADPHRDLARGRSASLSTSRGNDARYDKMINYLP